MRAATFSVKELAPVIDKAVAAAREKYKVGGEGPNALFVKWELVGRRLRDADLNGAEAFASHIAEGVSAAGQKVEPAVVKLPKGGILAGFFPVEPFNELQF